MEEFYQTLEEPKYSQLFELFWNTKEKDFQIILINQAKHTKNWGSEYNYIITSSYVLFIPNSYIL